MKINLLIALLLIGISDEEKLSDLSERYSSAEGIQWRIRSVVYSDIFDEADTTYLDFSYSPPDTFSLIGDKEKILGIADTLWVLSTRHHQVQKKNVEDTVMPADLILNWKDNYDLDSVSEEDSNISFELSGKEGVKPSKLRISADKRNRIESIEYPDTKGDQVTLTIQREKLSRPKKHELFYLNIPKGYDFIDLTK